MKFALSTCWNSHRHEDGHALLREIADLGFRHVELSHGIRLSLIPGILKAVEEGVVEVASLHNFCPLPVGVMGAAPNLYEPSAASHRERVMWLNNTLRTIDFAQRVRCDRVVLHSGSMRFWWRDPEPAVEKALELEGAERDSALALARAKGLKRLRGKRGAYMARLKETYAHVVQRAKERGVRFGLENREGFKELPLDEDMEALLEALKEHEVFGYWHDSGHAQLKARMGLLDHRSFLEKLRPRLLGFHLHDVNTEGRDHQLPGTGLVDWGMLAEFITEGDVVVLELSPRLQLEEIAASRDFLLRTMPALQRA